MGFVKTEVPMTVYVVKFSKLLIQGVQYLFWQHLLIWPSTISKSAEQWATLFKVLKVVGQIGIKHPKRYGIPRSLSGLERDGRMPLQNEIAVSKQDWTTGDLY